MPLIAVVPTPKPLWFPDVAPRNSTWHSERHQDTFRPLGFHLLPFTWSLSPYVLMWPCALKKKTKEDQKKKKIASTLHRRGSAKSYAITFWALGGERGEQKGGVTRREEKKLEGGGYLSAIGHALPSPLNLKETEWWVERDCPFCSWIEK